ncbi:MAG: hypothetical protein ABIH48_00445 [Candidatus Falkowbacteria bacterium]
MLARLLAKRDGRELRRHAYQKRTKLIFIIPLTKDNNATNEQGGKPFATHNLKQAG